MTIAMHGETRALLIILALATVVGLLAFGAWGIDIGVFVGLVVFFAAIFGRASRG